MIEALMVELIKQKVSASAEKDFSFKDNKTELAVAAALMGRWNIINDELGGFLVVALYDLCGGDGDINSLSTDEILDDFFHIKDGLNEDGTPLNSSEWYRDFMVRSGLCTEKEV